MNVAHMRKRKCDRSHDAFILRVRQCFEQDLREGKRSKLHNILERTTAATGVSRATMSRIETENDVHNWSTRVEVILK